MNTYHHYEFFHAETGEQIAEKFFTVQDTDLVFSEGQAIDLQPKSLIEQCDAFASELARNLHIPRRVIIYAEIKNLNEQ